MSIERSGAPAAPGAAAKAATVAGRPHAVGADHAGGAGARSFVSVLSSVGSQELEAPVAPATADSGALAAALLPLPAPDPADLLGQGLNRRIAPPEAELAGRPDGAVLLQSAGQPDSATQPQLAGLPGAAGRPEFAGRADVADAGIAAAAALGMLPVPGTAGLAGAVRDAGTQQPERALGAAAGSSARPGATGSGAAADSAGLARERLENAVDARAQATPEPSAGLLARAGANAEGTPADTGLAPLPKGAALRSGGLREAAAAADTQWHAGQPARGADTATAGGAWSDALAGLARGPASPRAADRPLLRPLLAAGSVSTGSWAEQAMAGGNGPVGATYTIEPATPVPEMAVAEKMNYWISRGVQNAELKLDAFGGGSVDVSISVNGNDAMVEFRTDQPEARRLLQDAMGHLRQMLEGEGLVLSGGFVGTSAQRDPGAQDRRSQAQAAKSAPALVELRPTEAMSALSRTPGRAVDLFV